MNTHCAVRPPRYKPKYVKANRLGPVGIRIARERDKTTYMLMQDRTRVQKGKGNA